MALSGGDNIEFMTSDPKGFQSELFVKLYGRDYFSTNLRDILIVSIDKESQLDVYTQFFMAWKNPSIILKMLFQVQDYIYHIPYYTYEKQVKSQLPKMLNEIGKEICYGPIVLYQHGALTEKQVESISGVKVIHEDDLEKCDDEFGIFHRVGHYIAFTQKDNVYTFYDSLGHHMVKEWTWIQNKKHKLIAYSVQIDNRSCGLYSSFYISQLKKYGDVKYPQFTFQDVHDWNMKLKPTLRGGSQINFTLVHNDEIENKAKEWILSFYKKLPFSISDITLNSQEKWSTSYPTKINLGLVWNQTPQDLMCLWIHEQLHRWEKTRDPAWLQYVKENYQNRDMDPDMVRFAGDDIDSNFAQHLVVIWNAFNITKQFYPDYIKADVAYVVFQKFVRDNWDRIQKDLEKFGLVIKDQKTLTGGQKRKKHVFDLEGKEKVQKPMKGNMKGSMKGGMKHLIVENEKIMDLVDVENLIGEGFFGGVFSIPGDPSRVIKFVEYQEELVRYGNYWEDQVQIWQQIDSDLIVNIYEYYIGHMDDFSADIYYTMDRVDHTAEYGLIQSKDKYSYITRLLEFLKKIQNEGICHGDLKLQNIGVKDNKFILIDLDKIKQQGPCEIDVYKLLYSCANALQIKLKDDLTSEELKIDNFLNYFQQLLNNNTIKGGNGNKDGYVCKCAFSRNKGVKSYTCLVDNELNLLRKIINDKEITTPEQLYQKLINNYKCSSSKNGIDQCVRDNLVQQYGSSVENVFKNALPLKNQIDTLTQWLSSSNIDLLASQLEFNHPHFKYMGIHTWDMFEDQRNDIQNKLNPEYIIKTIKENPTKTVFGWVLNLCHKFSSGTHWVAMGLVKQSDKQYKWLYYDSQDKDGPQTDYIDCDFRDGINIDSQQQKKYSKYESQYPQWWEYVQEIFSKHGFTINKVIDHNNFITQNDGYTCGYHAFYFLYLITTEKDKSINALSLQISATQTKVLDSFMQEFQKKVFELK